jgi:hemoglobin
MASAINDEGGEAPCWAHLVTDWRADITTRDDIRELVVAFYRDVATDDALGPVFAAAQIDWSVHIPKLVDFWAWQLLGHPGYERNPLRAHEPVHARTPFGEIHYQRWLALFESTVDDLFVGPNADAAKRRARRMTKALRRLLDGEAASGNRPTEVMWSAGGSQQAQ